MLFSYTVDQLICNFDLTCGNIFVYSAFSYFSTVCLCPT